jgi:hypothetical protein
MCHWSTPRPQARRPGHLPAPDTDSSRKERVEVKGKYPKSSFFDTSF